jgi:hypothetical protein
MCISDYVEWQAMWKNQKMGDLSKFEGGQNIGVHLAWISVTKTVCHIITCMKVTVSVVMSAHLNRGNTSSKRSSGQKSTLTERDRLLYIAKDCLVKSLNYCSTGNSRTECPWKSDILKVMLTHKQWCHNHKTSTSDNWRCMIWSDESSFFTLFPT